MRSTRLALAVLAAGAGLMGWATSGLAHLDRDLRAHDARPPAVRSTDVVVDAPGADGRPAPQQHGARRRQDRSQGSGL